MVCRQSEGKIRRRNEKERKIRRRNEKERKIQKREVIKGPITVTR